MKKSEILAALDENGIQKYRPRKINVSLNDNYFRVGDLGINITGEEDAPVIYAGTNGFGKPRPQLPRSAMMENFDALVGYIKVVHMQVIKQP